MAAPEPLRLLLKSRRVHIAGSTPRPDEPFMAQIARNLTDCEDGFLLRHRALIIDRDSKFTPQFRRILSDFGIRVVLTPSGLRIAMPARSDSSCRSRKSASAG